MANVLETVGKKLEAGEHVLHQYRVISNGKDGFLVLTNRNIRFLEQKGIFRTEYRVSVEIPYPKVRDVTAVASHRLELKTDAQQYNFTSLGDITAYIIEDEVNDIKKQISHS
jgi:hypothetical protein